MPKPYVVYCPMVPFSNASGGVKVVHRLVHELNAIGQEAYLNTWFGNPEWTVPRWTERTDDFIAIYPEIMPGNPLGAPHVVRWILYPTPHVYPETDYIVPYMRMFNSYGLPEERILYLPPIETELFTDPDLDRNGRLYYVGSKGLRIGSRYRVPEVDHWPELQRPFNNYAAFIHALQTCELVYSYDNMTAVCECARLCGCPVVIVHDSPFTKADYEKHELGLEGLGIGLGETDWALRTIDSAAFHDKYVALQALFKVRLRLFVEATQEIFA